MIHNSMTREKTNDTGENRGYKLEKGCETARQYLNRAFQAYYPDWKGDKTLEPRTDVGDGSYQG